MANEEVINGLSERGSHPVIRQPLRQWLFKITNYADKLEAGLDQMHWPEGTLSAQRQWIGRSKGASIKFQVDGVSGDSLEVFTTRPDTLLGVTYIVLAPEHAIVQRISSLGQLPAVKGYISEISNKSDLERTSIGKEKGKTGVHLGAYALHPITGEKIPIWIADYVLGGYGTGAVMAVPAHDERDFAFANKFSLPIRRVVHAVSKEGIEVDELPMTAPGIICNSGVEFDGLDSCECHFAIINKLVELNSGKEHVTYKLRDWVFSRQRYWGEPIPIYFPVEIQTKDGSGSPIDVPHRILYEQPIAVDDAELPLKLPELSDFHPGDDPQGCLARSFQWRYFKRGDNWYARETNTMPQVSPKTKNKV